MFNRMKQSIAILLAATMVVGMAGTTTTSVFAGEPEGSTYEEQLPDTDYAGSNEETSSVYDDLTVTYGEESSLYEGESSEPVDGSNEVIESTAAVTTQEITSTYTETAAQDGGSTVTGNTQSTASETTSQGSTTTQTETTSQDNTAASQPESTSQAETTSTTETTSQEETSSGRDYRGGEGSLR